MEVLNTFIDLSRVEVEWRDQITLEEQVGSKEGIKKKGSSG